MAMTEVVVIRPGWTDFDEQRRIQGTLDLPLNDRGFAHVEMLAGQLMPLGLDVLYAAAGEPTETTARLLGEQLGIEVKPLDELTNLHQGLWQGLPVDEVRRMNSKVFKQWLDSPEMICPPGGETVGDAVERIRESLHRPLKKGGTLGIVAPEPLATLIACVVRGERPLLPDPPCGGGKLPWIAILTGEGDAEEGRWTEVRLPAGASPHAGAVPPPAAGGLPSSTLSPGNPGELT